MAIEHIEDLLAETGRKCLRLIVNMDKRTLGRAIKRIRVMRGMTRIELATTADLPSEVISRMEQGKYSRPEETIKPIARALQLPPGCLAILARGEGKTRAMTDFVQSLQRLKAALVEAQEKGVAVTKRAAQQKERRKAV